MKLLKILVLMLISTASMLALDTKIANYDLGISNICDMKAFGNKVAVAGNQNIIPGIFFTTSLGVFEDNKWENLPNTININGKDEPVLTSYNSRMNFDSSGNIWVSGYSMYRWKDKQVQEFFIDDSSRKYRQYEQFCVDKYNNLWITSEIINDEKNYFRSEILKFDGKKFEVKYSVENFLNFSFVGNNCLGNAMAAMPDGSVVISRLNFWNDKDNNDPPLYPDIYIFKPDDTIEKIKLKTTYEEYPNVAKVITQILAEPNGNIWFTLDAQSWFKQGGGTEECCSGISLYNKGNWTLFTESNGLDKADPVLYRPVYNITNIGEGNYIVLGQNKIYMMGKDLILKELDWKDVLNKATFIPANKYYTTEDKVESYFSRFITGKGIDPMFGNMIVQNNGELWILTQKGIIVSNKITSVEDDIMQLSNDLVYPNPADDILRVSSFSEVSSYRIIDILGQTVLSGKIDNHQIDISNLAQGQYCFVYHSPDGVEKIIKFIKR